MFEHRKADVWAVLRFALRFGVPHLQAAALAWLSDLTKRRLLWHADTVLAVAEQHVRSRGAGGGGGGGPGGPGGGSGLADGLQQQQQQQQEGAAGDEAAAAARQLPLVELLERDLLAEQAAAGLKQLGSYLAAAERLRLARLREGLLRHVAGQWRALSGSHPVLVSPLAARGRGGARPRVAGAAALCAMPCSTPPLPLAPQRPQLRALQQAHPGFVTAAAERAARGLGGGGGGPDAGRAGAPPAAARLEVGDIDALFE
jgi:hypothetical protein